MKKYLMILFSSILAGFCITFGATVYLMCLNLGGGEFIAKFIGACMFTIGLFTIIHFNFWLYTGKVGYVLDNKPIYLLDCFICFIGNLIGSLGLASLIKLTSIGEKLQTQATPIVESKLNSSWYSIFIMSMMCGIMIYLAVEGHKRCKYSIGKVLFATMPIILFILCGFEHVVANITYFVYASSLNWLGVGYFVLMFLGNALGSILFDGIIKLVNYFNKPKEESNSIENK
jgi:formate transporter